MVKIILFYEGYVLELVLESKDHISNKFNLLGILINTFLSSIKISVIFFSYFDWFKTISFKILDIE